MHLLRVDFKLRLLYLNIWKVMTKTKCKIQNPVKSIDSLLIFLLMYHIFLYGMIRYYFFIWLCFRTKIDNSPKENSYPWKLPKISYPQNNININHDWSLWSSHIPINIHVNKIYSLSCVIESKKRDCRLWALSPTMSYKTDKTQHCSYCLWCCWVFTNSISG